MHTHLTLRACYGPETGKHGPGVTSAVDLIPTKPAARPEAVAPRETSTKEEHVSFADVLETETAEPDSSDELTAATTDTNVAAQAVPAQPPATPAINSPEAILAGLAQADAPDAAVEGSSEIPEIAAAVPGPGPQPALPTPAQAAVTPAPAATAQVATASKPAQPTASTTNVDTDEAGEGAEDKTSAPTENAQSAAPVTPAIAVPAMTASVATPATTQSTEAAPLSAPGVERAAAPADALPASTTKTQSAATPTTDAGVKAQPGDTKTVQTAAASADAAPELKTEAATTPAGSTVDAAATARAPTSEAARAAQTHPALQHAPATTLQVYQRMVERFDGRAQRYEVRLDPAELGRVDVRIEVGADKKVHAVLAAHDSAALSDLMRGQRSLERALSDAGFDLADGGIQFELSSDQGQNSANQNSDGGNANVWRGFKSVDVAVDAQTAAAARPWRSSRLDLVA